MEIMLPTWMATEAQEQVGRELGSPVGDLRHLPRFGKSIDSGLIVPQVAEATGWNR